MAMLDSNREVFCVRYRLPLIVGAINWCLGWGALVAITMQQGWHPSRGPTDVPFMAYVALMWIVLGVIGPVIIWRYSTSLVISRETVRVNKLFGLKRLDFRRIDISSARLQHKGRRLVLTIVLANGQRVEVDYWAHNFRMLQAYLGLH